MSKKYDEYVASKTNDKYYQSNVVVPRIPNDDKELTREIRDRTIIELVKKSIVEGIELTYGDIRSIVDDDPTEKEYENKLSHKSR